jgi:hypothetical protein
MKQSQGKFILFDLAEFSQWLNATSISRVIKLIQNHHTWIPAYKHFDGTNHFALLRGMENSHLERGFAEIAQNLTTFPDGTMAVCRSFEKIPAGIKGANTGALCIENLGSFDKNKDAMTQAHRAAIIKLNALLCKKFRLLPDANTIIYHHWFDLNSGERKNGAGVTKSCPGTAFFGGNKVTHAETNFFPLIKKAIKSLDVQPIGLEEVLYTARVTADALNVRIKPDASSTRIKALTKGILVNVYEEKNNWCRIDPTESHWVSGRFLERVVL